MRRQVKDHICLRKMGLEQDNKTGGKKARVYARGHEGEPENGQCKLNKEIQEALWRQTQKDFVTFEMSKNRALKRILRFLAWVF